MASFERDFARGEADLGQDGGEGQNPLKQIGNRELWSHPGRTKMARMN